MACANCNEYGHVSSNCPYTLYKVHSSQAAKERAMELINQGREFTAVPVDEGKFQWTFRVRNIYR